MKILKSFDTKIDAEELTEAIHKYWEWNVILIKRHWIKLITPLLLVILSIFLEILMIYTIYQHLFDDHKKIFWVLAILYMYTTFSRCLFVIIWIITNIIRQVKAKHKYIDSLYKAEYKQKWFEKFMKRTFITFVVHVIVLVCNSTIPFILINQTWIWSITAAIWILIIDIIFLIILNRVMYRLIEYEMTFNICTEKSFTTYKQKWFFKTDSMNISTSQIKVIQSSKDGISWALFQYGNLYIYTDWDLNLKDGKNLELTYIPDPKVLAKKLNDIIEKRKEEWDKYGE